MKYFPRQQSKDALITCGSKGDSKRKGLRSGNEARVELFELLKFVSKVIVF